MWGTTNVYQGVTLKEPSSKGDTLLIYNREQLLWWALNDQKKSIKLMADINVQGDKQLLKADGKTLALEKSEIVVWPYVKWDSDRTWYGTMKPRKVINGNNHTISGIYQNYGYGDNSSIGAIEAYDYVGFLSWAAHDISIWNLNISDSYLVGKYAGGFLGQKSKNTTSTNLSEFRNCSFRGYVKGDIYAGGFTGWYRTDGQDAKFYRCFNYGTIESGSTSSKKNDTGAGGIIGYLDITHTGFAQAHTEFNRCVNYGNITCFTPGGSVGGIVSKVWENNNGIREWRFCFNFGYVKKYDSSKKALAGSGLIGNYTNVNGNAIPNLLGCGNARKADTGTLLDELSWNYDDSKDQLPINIIGAKTNSSGNYYTSIKKDTSAATWWTNYGGYIIATIVFVIASIATAGAATAAFSAAAAVAETVLTGADIVMSIAIGAAVGLAIGTTIAAFSLTDYAKRIYYQARTIANTPISYTDNDLRSAIFAYDANLMMTTDSIGREANTDKSPLFKQHINNADANMNDSIPSIITDFNSNTDKLYFGYDKCNRIPFVNNDPSLSKKPTAHTFDEHGECTYCHFTMQPLEAVYQADGQVDYYAIKNYAQLNYLASAFNGDNEEAYKLYKGASFKLMNDIDYPANFLWTPIGSCTVDYGHTNESSSNWHHFTGKFDGQGHTIKGLKTDGYTNYAGLFGYVDGSENTTNINNITLSNCQFLGNVAGSIAGCTNTEISTNGNSLGKLAVESVAADSSVIVANTSYDKISYAGGLLGMVNRAKNAEKDLTVRYSYSNAALISYQMLNAGVKEDKTMGTLAGLYNYEPTDMNANPTFQHCYYGGISTTQQTVVLAKERIIEKYDLDDCYSIGEKTKTILGNTSSYYVPMNYIISGRLAYDLMNSSKVTENGQTTYFFTQKGNYPVLTNTKQPTLCKVNVEVNGQASSKGLQVADTIINTNTAKISVPFTYAGRTFKNAKLRGWDKEERTGNPTYEGAYNDFSELYKTPTRYYTLVLEPKEIPAIANVQNATEWKGAGVLAGYAQTNIMSNLYLQGSDAWSLQQAPQCIDGTYKTVNAGMPLISDVKGSRVGAMHEGVPAGTFAVLPLTEAELGASFQYLGKNIITKDGRATCISLEDGQTDGFTYPSCFGSEVHIMANRGEYTRKVRRDGTYETLYLPFGLTSVETAEGDFSADDQIDLCFVNPTEGKDGLSEDGKSFRLTSQGAYYMAKEALAVDSLTEDEVSIPGVPYLIRFH